MDALIDDAVEQLQSISDSARLDAELLLARSIDMPRSYVFAHADEELDAAAVARFRATLERRLAGEPMAYISGEKEFWSMTLMVSPATLVPRPDTELLVELAIARVSRHEAMRVLDLGTGSGAIALAIARERPLSQVTASDISAEALAIARQNARQLDIANIEFLQGSWTAPLAGRLFDVVVSNPPYIARGDAALAALRFEPLFALESGPDGLRDIRIIAATAPRVLADKGRLLLEHGFEQADAVAEILRAAGWVDVHCMKDLSGLPRVTSAARAA
ncbi:MAG: peptide chain release factor N(5)-glutamine methyltransferase [Halioglobus sp.]|nr:peptide chain release factor N(5)-glutamine methyltransferase [Halioglobus sp.]